MTAVDRITLIRAAGLFVPAAAAVVAAGTRPLSRRDVAAIIVSFTWTSTVLVGLNAAAPGMGWWRFAAWGGTFLGSPVDLLVGWAMLWGVLPVLVSRQVPVLWIACGLVGLDVLVMPRLGPVVQLGRWWLVGEAAAVALAFWPAASAARWTIRDTHLAARATVQCVLFTGLLLILLPCALGASWTAVAANPAWVNSLAIQTLVLLGLPGLSALQEFVTRGRGTPLPFDPPRALVTSGVYRYVANPMQLSTTLILFLLAWMFRNPLLASAALMGILYSIGLAAWDESGTMSRFGGAFDRYRKAVRNWLPRWRPHVAEPATLYVAATCETCSQLRAWLERRSPVGLLLLHAEDHPSQGLTRLTYEPAKGPAECSVAAFARALEHVNLPWAMVGITLRLPMISAAARLLADVFGPPPRRVCRDTPSAASALQHFPE